MYSGTTKIYYRKAVRHLFTKPVQIEGTTPTFFFTSNLFFIVVHISAARRCECMLHPFWRVCGKNLNIVSLCAVSPVVHISYSCVVTRGAHIVSLCAVSPVVHTSNISSCHKNKLFFQFSCGCKNVTCGFPIIHFCNPVAHYETPCIKTKYTAFDVRLLTAATQKCAFVTRTEYCHLSDSQFSKQFSRQLRCFLLYENGDSSVPL
jgi:hypothetical protein